MANKKVDIMITETTLEIFRILNKSKTDIAFQTDQEIEIVITPGSIIDLYSFEVSQSPSFKEVSQSERLKIDIAQTCSVSQDYFEQIKSGIEAFRESYTVGIKEKKDAHDQTKKQKANPTKPRNKKSDQKKGGEEN